MPLAASLHDHFGAIAVALTVAIVEGFTQNETYPDVFANLGFMRGVESGWVQKWR